MESIVAVAAWITSIGGAVIILAAAARRFFAWPVADIWMDAPRGGETPARLTVVNKSDQRIDVVSLTGLWPRGMRFDNAGIERTMIILNADEPWNQRPREPNYRAVLPVALAIAPGGNGLFDFAVSGNVMSSTPWALIRIRSARFIARTSWMPVKMLHSASASMSQT